jgi:hypothetical protein
MAEQINIYCTNTIHSLYISIGHIDTIIVATDLGWDSVYSEKFENSLCSNSSNFSEPTLSRLKLAAKNSTSRGDPAGKKETMSNLAQAYLEQS